MEEEIKIPLKNKKYIYGILRGSLKNSLIIFVHGFTGHKNEHQFFNGARFFEKNGLSTFRFDLYNWRDDARKLDECTLSLHGQDLDKVVDYFRNKGVKKISVVGHSFGGPSVLLSKKKDFDDTILWEPSDDKDVVLKARYLKELDKYHCRSESSFGFIISKEMYQENKKLKPSELIKEINVPIKIIVAGLGTLIEEGRKLLQNANEPKAFAIIPSATHCFDEDGAEEKLFQETLDWIK